MMTVSNNQKTQTYKLFLKLKIVFGIFCVLALLNIFALPVFANTSVDATASVKPVCGNNVKEEGEDCDNSDLNGQTCRSRGFSGGSLTCDAVCTLNVSQCVSGGGGGGAYNLSGNPSLLSPEDRKTDANNDNKVNFLDFNILMANWGATGSNTSDFNGDGIVDIFDFNLLMIYWTI
jgi:hypothetical protein